VFDSDKKLLGFTYLTSTTFRVIYSRQQRVFAEHMLTRLILLFVTECGSVPAALFVKATYFKREVYDAACRLSTKESLPFPCPDFVCPVDTVLPGYPWVELVDVRSYTQARNGFKPVDVTQFPPPGSILRYGTSTIVTVTATDASNRSLSCTSSVIAPRLLPCGTVEVSLPAGTYGRTGVFQPNRTIVTGTVFKMKGILQNQLGGRGSVTARLRKGSDKYTGSVVFQGNRTKGAINNLFITSPFSFLNASSSLAVDLDVINNTNVAKNAARYVVYCQEVFAAYS
jgi:hypothetical protein